MSKRPLILCVLTYVIMLVLTQFLAYQQYSLAKEHKKRLLGRELTNVESRFRSILANCITAANTLAIMYKQNTLAGNFDSIAHDIILINPYAEALQITEDGIITNVYPRTEYQSTIGINTRRDTTRLKEEQRALEKNEIYFAGPRPLRMGGVGILGKVPIIINGRLKAVAVVLVRMPTIVRFLQIADSNSNRFAYELRKKNTSTNAERFFLTDERPAKASETAAVDIPEGDWELIVSHSEHYVANVFPYLISFMGLLLSLLLAYLVYKRAREPFYLKQLVDSKSQTLNATVEQLARNNRELDLLNNVNDIIIKAKAESELVKNVCDCLVDFGAYNLSWVCHKPDVSSDQVITPAAAAGEVGYLTTVRLSLTENAAGPTARVLLTGDTVITNNVIDTPYFKPWYEAAKKYGIAASIVLPLRFGDDSISALNIYSTEVNAFADHEVAILERIAANLSLAVKNIRTEKEKESTKYLLGERLKELSTIYKVNRILLNEDWPREKVFHEIINILPIGWQYPETCVARIVLGGEQYLSDGYAPGHASQRKEFVLSDGTDGNIEVSYLEERPKEAEGPFLAEERDLINTLAELISVFFDRASQRRALEQSENKFRNLVERSIVGVYIMQNGYFVYVNPRMMEDSGYSEEELLSNPVTHFIYGDDIGLVQQKVQERLSGEVIESRYELRIRRKNGEVHWLEMFGAATVYQGNPAIIGTMVNITDKKNAFDELRKSEANLNSIFEHTEVSYLLLDVDFNVVSLNKRMYNLYEELAAISLKPGDNLVEMILPEKREAVRATYAKVARENKPMEYETSYAVKEGYKYFLANVMPIDSDGEVIGLCISSLDITRIKNLELERERIIAALLQRNLELEEFGQIVSHNLRGPLATILGLTNMFKAGVTDEEKDFILEGISSSAEKLDAVIMEMNNILHMKSDTAEASVDVYFDEIIEEVKEKLSGLVLMTNAVIETDVSMVNEMHTVRSFIYNILYNLISNGLKYREEGRPPHVTIWSEKKPGAILLAVKDNGIGIDMEKHGDQLFQLNRRFHYTAEGKGMGLYIAKAQVDALNGTIKIESEPGVGTTIRIVLPV